MTTMLGGALVGAGALILIRLLMPTTTNGPVALALYDARLARGRRVASLTSQHQHAAESARVRKFGAKVADVIEARGVRLPPKLGADLSMVGQSMETFLARSIGAALLGFVVLLLNNPVLTLGQSRTEPSVLAVMIDRSMSMRVPDVYVGVERQGDNETRGQGEGDGRLMTRMEAVMSLLGDDERALLHLAVLVVGGEADGVVVEEVQVRCPSLVPVREGATALLAVALGTRAGVRRVRAAGTAGGRSRNGSAPRPTCPGRG
jgi:hypothetical protein